MDIIGLSQGVPLIQLVSSSSSTQMRRFIHAGQVCRSCFGCGQGSLFPLDVVKALSSLWIWSRLAVALDVVNALCPSQRVHVEDYFKYSDRNWGALGTGETLGRPHARVE